MKVADLVFAFLLTCLAAAFLVPLAYTIGRAAFLAIWPRAAAWNDDHTPTDVDERALQLADEIDRLHDENDALAAELVKERNLMERAAGSLRAYIGTHGDGCSNERACATLAEPRAVLAEMDIAPRKNPSANSTPQVADNSGDGKPARR